MKREFLKTGDGSLTIHLPEWNEQYHSKHGAIAEAIHVFVEAGLEHFIQQNPTTRPIKILEIGFGTGLNAFLSLLFAEKNSICIQYTGVEAYPVALEEAKQLNYSEALKASNESFLQLHETEWETNVAINENFSIDKQKKFFSEIDVNSVFNLIYFDAFGARVQPELWTEEIFQLMFKALTSQGILVTYAAKGSVRRAMESVGFKVERLPGPPGKREMLRATKQM